MVAGGLYKGEKVFDDSNVSELIGDGTQVFVEGEMRLLSRLPPPLGSPPVTAVPFADSGLTLVKRSDLSAMIKEQAERKRRVSDYCDFPAYDQNGIPTCWANGPSQAYTTTRRIMGLPLKVISACSVAVPISGGHSGGYEGDAFNYLLKNGGCSVDLWSNNDTNRRLSDDPKVIADRKITHGLELIKVPDDDFLSWATVCLATLAGGFAYDWMSHVMMSCDVVEIEADSFGFRQRNSWKDSWGGKNDLGFGGFNVWREGRRGTPNSGYVWRQVQASIT